jgi:glycine oxidase
VIIVGGGVIGCACAFYLAQAGARSLLLERTHIAAEASGGAGGLLTAHAQTDEPGPLLDLMRAGRALFEPLAAELRARTEMDIELRPLGPLVPASGETQAAAVRRRVAWQAERGLPAEWLDAGEARRLEPGLADGVRGAGWFREDHHVNNTELTQALATAARQLGARIRTGVQVTDLVRVGDRIAGVQTETGTLEADAVVVAAGCWSARFEKALGLPIPVVPAKGQMVVARLPVPATRHVVYQDVYVIPRASGEHILGSTVEYVGHDKRVTVEGLTSILARATRLVPALREAEMVASWGCLRPATPDGMPVIGPVPGRRGALLASGHFRHGILLGPVTGRLVADLVVAGRAAIPLEAFRPDRPFPPGPAPSGASVGP